MTDFLLLDRFIDRFHAFFILIYNDHFNSITNYKYNNTIEVILSFEDKKIKATFEVINEVE